VGTDRNRPHAPQNCSSSSSRPVRLSRFFLRRIVLPILIAIHSSFSASVVYVRSKLRNSLVSFGERGMVVSSSLNSAAFALHSGSQNVFGGSLGIVAGTEG
jgi:hypothetical protein